MLFQVDNLNRGPENSLYVSNVILIFSFHTWIEEPPQQLPEVPRNHFFPLILAENALEMASVT